MLHRRFPSPSIRTREARLVDTRQLGRHDMQVRPIRVEADQISPDELPETGRTTAMLRWSRRTWSSESWGGGVRVVHREASDDHVQRVVDVAKICSQILLKPAYGLLVPIQG